MWTPNQHKYSVERTNCHVTPDQKYLFVEVVVANMQPTEKPELWLHPADLPGTQSPPDSLKATQPEMKSAGGSLTAISHFFQMDPSYRGRIFTPIVGVGGDGNSGSAIRIP